MRQRKRVRMISDDSHHANARTICVVRVVPTVDSRSERLHVLLTVSCNRHCPLVPSFPAVVSVSKLSKEINAALE